MKYLHSIVCALAVAAAPAAVSQTGQEDTTHSRQVILIIGDGMGEQQITIARNYLEGATGRLLMDNMPVRAAVQVLTIEDKPAGKPVYVADSANTATSIATGVITSPGRIATSAGTDEDLTTIVELAESAGFRTGLVTTASVTDATAAAFVAHISMRLCENPELVDEVFYDAGYRDIHLGGCPQDARKRGGPGAISEQLARSSVDVILGGGARHFAVRTEAGHGSVLELARAEGFHTIDNLEQLQRSQPGRPLLGLFASGNLPLRLQGEAARIAEKPKPSLLNRLHPYLGSVTLPETMACEPNPAFKGTPSLKKMTDTALEHLAADNDRGFFLMIESASIDKAAHKRNPCGSIGEVAQLEEALHTALAFAAKHPQTLVLVTADHTQAAQLVPYTSLYAQFPVPIYTPGHLARIETPEGGVMAVNYATNDFRREEHTGAAVPLYANAEGIGRVSPFLPQPELFAIMVDYLGL
ncbi:alkaline phosphatase [Pseudohalioglobus lutimaris]|uniref:Alkaline phosphatase n=1 Tax=Pseudohalioglobus lutimaris TaxID=1737061 RepID=A0A2N5X6M6_9GAMM|nr:alkaline phosphatase [Pseudohalioglobus lutimaris]PLW70144.1 alkaline phosphatase [Pseudohalioglobus lutimaris]